MDNLVRITEVLVWPIAVLVMVYWLRRPLGELIPYLQKLKYKELEIEFNRDLERLRERTRETETKGQEAAEVTSEDYYLEEVRKTSPRNGILESWLALESTAIATVQVYKLIEPDRRVDVRSAIDALRNAGVLSEQDTNNFDELRRLRNTAVHELSNQLSEAEAARFMEIARDIGDVIAVESWSKFGGCSH